MDLVQLVNKFEGARQIGKDSYQVTCPCHDDKKQSLTISKKGNKILIYCHAGCDTKKILKQIGLTEKDLFLNDDIKSRIVEEYFYKDENGNYLYKVIRLEPKNFMHAQYNTNKWIFNMQGVRHVLYNLSEVIKSDVIYWVEGEKDANNLISIGLVATTSSGGASGFNKYKDEYVSFLKDKIVYIIPDNDEAGKKYACNIMQSLEGIAKYVKILDLSIEIPGLAPKSDISDVLSKYGRDKTIQIIEKLKKQIDFSIYTGEKMNLQILKNILKDLNISVRYNEITKETEVIGLPTEYSPDSYAEILPAYICEICKSNNIKYKESDISNELLLISNSNRFNPIQDMLSKNEWDKKDRFPTLFEIIGIQKDELSKTLVKKWMQQTTMIAFNDNCELFGIDGVLVFQGKQGCGKTRFIRNLALKPEWFKEGAVIDLNVKDSIIEASKGWIVELGEIDSTLKKKQSALKAFLTSSMDEVRVPYGRKSSKKPRRTSFFASVNPDEFLVDDTGNRRYWIVPVKEIKNEKLEKLGKNWIIQLWIQAYNEIKNNPQSFRLLPEEKRLLDERNNNFSEFVQCEEEITLKMEFKKDIHEEWTTVEINEFIFDKKSSSTMIGRALSKIKNKYPDLVEIRKTNTGRVYILPIKKKK